MPSLDLDLKSLRTTVDPGHYHPASLIVRTIRFAYYIEIYPRIPLPMHGGGKSVLEKHKGLERGRMNYWTASLVK